MNDNPVQLVTTKPDKELAEELKLELLEAAKPWCEICTKGLKLGFQIQANFAPNAFGQIVVQQLILSKIF